MIIRRDIIDVFKQWKEKPKRKPLLLKGARQIGKSWVMETFGKEYFDYCAKFDFDRQPELRSAFQVTKDPKRILKELALYSEVPLIPGKTLVVFDEIQECEEAFNSLKYFCEEVPEYHIIAAGSLLGVAVKKRKMTVPVGKVEVIRMFPVTFKEFLRVSDEQTFDYVESLEEPKHLPEIVLNKLKTEYRRRLCEAMAGRAGTERYQGRIGCQETDSHRDCGRCLFCEDQGVAARLPPLVPDDSQYRHRPARLDDLYRSLC